MALESPIFRVLKPLPLPIKNGKGGGWLDRDEAVQSLKALEAFEAKGVYIFASLFGSKLTPWYVGQAKKTFGQEVFAPDKIAKYSNAISRHGVKRAELHFIALPTGKGPTNVTAIRKLETYLINQCSRVNNDLLNKQQTKVYVLRVQGVMNFPQGKPSVAAASLRKMLD